MFAPSLDREVVGQYVRNVLTSELMSELQLDEKTIFEVANSVFDFSGGSMGVAIRACCPDKTIISNVIVNYNEKKVR